MSDTAGRLRARLATLRSVSRALARPLDVSGVLNAAHVAMARALDVTICFFGMYDASSQSVEVIWQVHQGVELPGGHFPLGSGPSSQAIRQRQPQLIRRWTRQAPKAQLQYATERPGLPESAVFAPLIFDGEVIGVLAVQSYESDAYDDDDVALVQSIADQLAITIVAAHQSTDHQSQERAEEVETIFASMPDALLVLDEQGRLVRINSAAREMLGGDSASVIFGHPVDQPQAGQWPLGNQQLTRQLKPLVDELRRGAVPSEDLQLSLDSRTDLTVSCKASVLFKAGAPAGGVMVLRQLAPLHR